MEYLIAHAIPLEMCPMSNVRTGVVSTLLEHPIQRYFKAGMVVTVNTDDPKMFQTRMAEEYRLLTEKCGFSKSDIRELILSGIRAAWLPEHRKTALTAEFRRNPGWEDGNK
jgi:adenosine deaminase